MQTTRHVSAASVLVLILISLLAPSASLRAARPDEDDPPRTADDWHRQLQDPVPGKRRTAVKRLAEVGDLRAWEAVLDALDDVEPEVADEAQLALAGISDDKALKLVLARSGLKARDPWVQVRVAEALGRTRISVDGEELAELARKHDGEVARMLCFSLERRARDGVLAGDPERAARAIAKTWRMQKDPGVRAAAWCALERLDPEEALRLVPEGLRARDPALRVAALQMARLAERDEALTLTLRFADDPAWSVRSQAVETLAAIGTRPAALVLVGRLAHEPEARVSARVVTTLQELSGLRYRANIQQWKHWAEGLPSDWTAGPAALSKQVAERAGGAAAGRSASFGGLPIQSGRVAFVIDLSGSIWREQADGSSRKQKVDELLRVALEKLPPATRFNVIPYTTDPLPWRPLSKEAKGRAVQDALEFFRDCKATGRGNYYDAVQLALGDPEIDTIIALTDGVPTGGRRWNLDLMVTLLLEQNRFRRVSFDAVLVDARPGVERHWRRLAAGSGGQVLSITF